MKWEPCCRDRRTGWNNIPAPMAAPSEDARYAAVVDSRKPIDHPIDSTRAGNRHLLNRIAALGPSVPGCAPTAGPTLELCQESIEAISNRIHGIAAFLHKQRRQSEGFHEPTDAPKIGSVQLQPTNGIFLWGVVAKCQNEHLRAEHADRFACLLHGRCHLGATAVMF